MGGEHSLLYGGDEVLDLLQVEALRATAIRDESAMNMNHGRCTSQEWSYCFAEELCLKSVWRIAHPPHSLWTGGC